MAMWQKISLRSYLPEAKPVAGYRLLAKGCDVWKVFWGGTNVAIELHQLPRKAKLERL